MNRFLRSALFPVVVMTLIVWLGTQTLIGHRHPAEKKTTSDLYSQVQNRAGEKVDMALESFMQMITAEIAERRR